MDKKSSNPWMRVTVVEVRQGAKYEGVIYDQDLVVRTTNGKALTLFDMTPMVAAGVHPGDILDVVVAISTPVNLKWANTADGQDTAIIDSVDYQPLQSEFANVRDELFRRSWCILKTSMGYFLISRTEVMSLSDNKVNLGEHLSWEDGRLDLMGWKHAT